ncbi:MAG: hypothetical protein IBX62_03760 [Coriobacteriia bacterium]|nr:hypothetical protein [Coriobacteriia bacterium]
MVRKAAPAPGVFAVAAFAVLLALSAATAGCDRSSADGEPSGVHGPSVTPQTYTEVRDAVASAGYRAEGGRILMTRIGEERVRADGEFVAEDGRRRGALVLEERDGGWTVVEEEPR